jgi:hypothetical protein
MTSLTTSTTSCGPLTRSAILPQWSRYALAAVTANTAAHADIVHYDLTDATASGSGDLMLYFDVDNTALALDQRVRTTQFGGYDFRFGIYANEPSYYLEGFKIRSSGVHNLTLDGPAHNSPISRLDAGTVIGPGTGLWAVTSYMDSDNFPTSTWSDIGAGYVGLQLDAPGSNNWYYGWARFTYDDAGNALTLHEFAYQRTMNTPITAGDTGVVPEPGSVMLAAMGATGLTALRRRRAQAKAA